jgi:hypothetical protein
VRVTLYNSLDQVVGHEWAEAMASNFGLSNQLNQSINFSYATMLSPTEIPLDGLNEGLQGFGPESPIKTLNGQPEPSSLVLGGIALTCVLVATRRRRATA